MKRTMAVLCSLIIWATAIVTNVYADAKESESVSCGLLSPYYQQVASVTFDDLNAGDGTLLLSINSMPDFNTDVIDSMSLFCRIGSIIPGCKYVKYGKLFYRYVNKGMQADVRLKDAGNPETIVWEGHMSDGDTIQLGTDHPDGYIIEMQCYPAGSMAFAKLLCPDNLSFE